MRPMIALCALVYFVWLAAASLHYKPMTLGGFVEMQLAAYKSPSRAERAAAGLKEVYGLTDADVARPVVLWK